MDIEALAKKAGMVTELQSGAASCVWTEGLTAVSADQLEAFAALVAAAEREACAKACEALWDEEANAAANGNQNPKYHDCIECAYAIRERSNAEVTGGPLAARPVD